MADNDILVKSCSLIKTFEGFSAVPYQNPGDRPTIGYGNTFYENFKPVTMNDPEISSPRALQLLEFFVQRSLDMVMDLVTVQMTDNQIVALTSFEYNTGHLKGSTLLEKLNAGDTDGAANQLDLWVHEGERILPVLVKRRSAEKNLFLA